MMKREIKYDQITNLNIQDGYLNNDKAADAFQDLFVKLQLLQSEYAKLETTKKALLPSPASEVPLNMRKMLKFLTSVIKIQAWWRRIFTMKKLEGVLRASKAKLSGRKSNQSPEEAAIKEFTSQLKNKKLTPESFFRICDTEYKQSITVAQFKSQLLALNVLLSRAQISRLVMILDEDIEGHITLEEYNNALEAYAVSGEKHKPLNGSALNHAFEHRCLFKMITELKKKNISSYEMYNACDVNDDSRVNVSEMRNFVEGLSSDFNQKEIHALMNYLDINNNGVVEKEEFAKQLSRAEQTMRQSLILNKQVADKRVIQRANNYTSPAKEDDSFLRFEEEEMGGGDQTFLPETTTTSKQPPPKQQESNVQLSPEQLRRKQIIEKMEKEGISFQSFFNQIKNQTSNGLIPLGLLIKAIEQSYPTVSIGDRNFLIKECIKERTKIDFVAFEELFSRFSKNLMPSSTQTFQTLATTIVKKMGSTPLDSIKQFFRAQDIGQTDVISEIDFQQMFLKIVPSLNQSSLSQAFKSMNVDLDGFVQMKDLMEVLLSYVTISGAKASTLSSIELRKMIPGIDSMSPRTKCDNVVQFVLKELQGKSLKAISIFKMADASNTGNTKAVTLEASFKKILPNLQQEIILEVMQAFKVQTPQTNITRQDFEIVFKEEQVAKSNNPLKEAGVPPQKQLDDEMVLKWVKKLDFAMQQEGINPNQTFKAADPNHDGMISVNELRDTIKRFVPEESLSFIDLKKVMMAFDTSRNGNVDEQEFLSLLEKARNSNVALDKPQEKQKSVEDSMPADRRSKLPTKDQIGDKQIISSTKEEPTGMSLQVNNIDDKINIKKVFGEVPINEDGKIIIPHISRRLSQEKASDGSTIKPSEYMPILKALDASNSGVVDAKDVITFLDKYCRTNNLDCTLEIKYMANFIEFRIKSKNTKVFFENNSKLKSGTRLMEVEIMSELNKTFGFSMQIGNTIYKKLEQIKGSNNFQLDDLCQIIDGYRIVKIEPVKALTDSQKLDPQAIISQLKVKMAGLPKRIQAEISSRLQQVDEKSKNIPYSNFFVEFVEDNQLLSSNESKAIYQHIQTTYQIFNFKTLQQLGILVGQAPPPQQKQPVVVEEVKEQKAKQQSPEVVDMKLIVKSIEEQIKKPLESALEDIFTEEIVPVVQFHKKIIALSDTVDKRQLTLLSQTISKATPGRLAIKDIVIFLAAIPGKYSQDAVIKELASEIEQPIVQTLSNEGLTASEAYTKNDYLDVISNVSTLSKFKALSLFYDLSQQQDELFGKTLIQKLSEYKQPAAKKGVTFPEPKKDELIIKKLLTELLENYSKVATDIIIESALNKLQTALKQYKTPGDAISKFDSSGKGVLSIDWFRQRLDDIKSLQNEEKIVLTFIPLENIQTEIPEVNVSSYFQSLRTLPAIDKNTVSSIKQKLLLNYEAIKRLIQPQVKASDIKPAQEEEKKSVLPLPNNGPLKQMNSEIIERSKNINKFIELFNANLKDPKKKQGIITLLESKNLTKEGVPYSTFYDHIEKEWSINIKTLDQQKKIFQQELDIKITGKFNMNDFIGFCRRFSVAFDYSLGLTGVIQNMNPNAFNNAIHLKRGNTLSVGKLQYSIDPKKDFYKGIPTILNSELAALVTAEQIYNSIKEGELFFDQDFGPKDEKDENGSSKAMYFSGIQPQGYPDPEFIEWIRPEDYCRETPKFIREGASANDVKQGRIGNCWFISALSVLAIKDELLIGGIDQSDEKKNSKNFQATQQDAKKFSKGVYPPLFHCYRKKGLYVFRFFKDFNWVYVLIDDRLPCQNSKPVFGTCKNENETWVPLIEKAYAKLHTCYEALISGFIDDALSELTGFVAEKVILHDQRTSKFPHKNLTDKDVFWDALMKRNKDGCLMGCSRSNKGESEYVVDGFKTGIIGGHAYGIMDVLELDIENANIAKHKPRLIRVRNPWGQKEWNGKWSDKSDEVEEYKVQINKYIDLLEDQDERFEVGEEDGEFFINYVNWRNIFNNMFVCVDFPESWSGQRWSSEWDETCSGGIPSPLTQENKKRWALNPQYAIQNKGPEVEVFISLAQPDGRGQLFEGEPIKFPYSELIHPIIFTVIELPMGQKKLDSFDEKFIKGASVLKEHKEVSLRLKLGPGTFVIVPSTKDQGQYGKFTLSVYVSEDNNIICERLDKPENRHYPIKEEEESYFDVQPWKVDLCQHRIKYMIQEEDQVVDSFASDDRDDETCDNH